MKVLIYSEYFFPIPGGVQRVVLELASGLAVWKNGSGQPLDVTVVTRTVERTENDSKYPFRLVRRPGLRTLIRLIRDTNVLHLAGPALLPLALGLALRKQIVVEHHGFQVACPNGLMLHEPTQMPCPGHFMAGRYGMCYACNRGKEGAVKSALWIISTHLRRRLAQRVAANITPTNWLASILRLNRMKTVYHGVSANPPASIPPYSPSFAFLGRLVSAKGIHLLLQAADLLGKEGYKFQLKIIGDGTQMPELERIAAPRNGQIELLGHISDDKVDGAVANAAAVVMPSLGGEVFGLVAAENMRRGKLVIVSDLGSLQEVVGDTGLVFAAGDAAGLATCLRRVLNDPSLAVRLGDAARARAMRLFNSDSMIQKHASLYEKAAAGRRTLASGEIHQ